MFYLFFSSARPNMFEKKWLYVIVFLYICAANFCFCETENFTQNFKETYVIRYFEGRQIVPVAVELDLKQQTEHVISFSPTGWKSVSFYDFSLKKVAYKDSEKNLCFVGDLMGETMTQDRKKLLQLNNGVVKGFYIPTFIIQREVTDAIEAENEFGLRISQFCNGSTVLYVTRDSKFSRKKRSTPISGNENGQFTHHSYGHYGHQSNNYAHYGHESYVTGSVDKNGNLQNKKIHQNQVRSESTQSSSPTANSQKIYTTNRRTQSGNQSPYQPQTPQRTRLGSSFPQQVGGGTGQFSLETAQESGYQLNLPLGLQAGNAFRGGIRSQGQYGAEGIGPQTYSDFQQYPDRPSIISTYRPGTSVSDGRDFLPISSLQSPMPSSQHFRGGLIPTGITQNEYSSVRQNGRQSKVDTGQEGVRSIIQSDTASAYQPTDSRMPTNIQAGTFDSRESRPRVIQPGGQRTLQQSGVLSPVAPNSDFQSPSMAGEQHPGTSETRYIIPSFQSGLSSQIGQVGPGRDRQFQPTSFTRPGIDRSLTDSRQIIPGGQGIIPGYTDSQTTNTQMRVPHIESGRFHGTIPANSISRSHTPDTYPLSPSGNIPTRQDSVYRNQVNGLSVPGSPESSEISQINIRQTGASPQDLSDSKTFSEKRPTISASPQIGSLGDVFYTGKRGSGDSLQVAPNLLTGTQSLNGRVIPDHQMSRSNDARGSQTYPQNTRTGSPYADFLVPGQSHGTFAGSAPSQVSDVSSQQGYQLRPTGATLSEPRTSIISGRDIPSQTQSVDSLQVAPNSLTGTQSLNGRVFPDHQVSRSDDARGSQTYPQNTRTRSPYADFLVPGQSNGRFAGSAPSQVSDVSSQQGYQLRPAGATLSEPGTSIISGREIPSQTQPTSGIIVGGSDLASSQTQIQAGMEGTAAKASSSGQFRGLGSQTQVQGGYSGNGSFSAQAQSGFTGGATQSQVQGGKHGGLSGSSSLVEQLGSAQSQVQIGQPDGSAGSSAQGRFSRGMTQVQTQSNKSGGSAGAEGQSRGLSSSQVQINIGGEESRQQNGFQGTVSASVRGGHSSGQSQTQLHGRYDSGRSYVATAQGGFDSSSEFHGSVPIIGSVQRIPYQTSPQPSYIRDDRNVDSGRHIQVSPERTSGLVGPLTAEKGRSRSLNQDSRGGSVLQSGTDRSRDTSPHVLRHQDDLLSPRLSGSYPQGMRTPEENHRKPGEILQLNQNPLSEYGNDQSRLLGTEQRFFQRPNTAIPGLSQPDYANHHSTDLEPSVYAPPIDQTSQQIAIEPRYIPGYSKPQLNHVSSNVPDIRRDRGFPSLPVPVQYQPGYQSSVLQFPSALQPGYQSNVLRPSIGLQQGYQPNVLQTTNGLQPEYQPNSFQHGSFLQPGFKTGYPNTFDSRTQPSDHISSSHLPSAFQIHSSEKRGIDQQYGASTGIQPSLQDFQFPSGIMQSPPQISPAYPSSLASRQNVSPPQTHFQQSGYNTGFIQPPPQKYPGIPSSSNGEQHILPTGIGLQQPTYQPGLMQQVPESLPSDIHGFGVPDSVQSRPHTSQSGVQHPGSRDSLQRAPDILQPGSSYPEPPDSGQVTRGQQSSSTVSGDLSSTIPVQQPGVLEPDLTNEGNCCEALRNLKRRCCSRSQGQNGKSASCCSKTKKIVDDFDFDDDFDENTNSEPCKIVKAICYIVYKPVGKARICKPTGSNGC